MTTLGDPNCTSCGGYGEVPIYGRLHRLIDTERCSCISECEGCGELVADGTRCPCWGDMWIDHVTYGLALAGTAATTAAAA